MKDETMQAKLMALLAGGDTEKHEKLEETKKQVNARKGKIHEISEDEIQTFREAQGITYFLRAPALFSRKTCKHCGESFLVSRLYVAYCSYTCIRKSLEEDGFEWRKGYDLDTIIKDVYDGNEPIWIRNVNNLQRCLQVLLENSSEDSALLTISENSNQTESQPSPTIESPTEKPGGLELIEL